MIPQSLPLTFPHVPCIQDDRFSMSVCPHRHFYCLIFETRYHCVLLAVLELPVLARLVSNSQRSTYFSRDHPFLVRHRPCVQPWLFSPGPVPLPTVLRFLLLPYQPQAAFASASTCPVRRGFCGLEMSYCRMSPCSQLLK